MQRHVATLSVILLLGALSSVQAHGNMRHVMGTVSAVDSNHMEVKTTDGKVVSAKLDKETMYFGSSRITVGPFPHSESMDEGTRPRS